MKKIYILLALVLLAGWAFGQNNNKIDYNRSSLYSILLVDTNTKMSKEIISAYMEVPVPEKYNNHNLSLRYLTLSRSTQKSRTLEDIFAEFAQRNQIAKRMAAKWFNRDRDNGAFDVSLIAERGLYNASMSDWASAMHTVRGRTILSDAGEQLIGNSFVVVHNITYIDKEEQAQAAKQVFNVLGAVAGLFGLNVVQDVADLGASISNTIAGFAVNVQSLLYKLNWDEETAGIFYSQYYYDSSSIDMQKKKAFEANKDLFKLEYVGSYMARSEKTVARGLHKPEDVFRKVLARAIDKNIVALQQNFDVFKVKEPIYAVQDGYVMAQIGLKEGVSPSSKYEVLECVLNDSGKVTYQRKGIIKPVPKKIWDNRYMASEEGADNASLPYTTFVIVSGSGFTPGMLIREVK